MRQSFGLLLDLHVRGVSRTNNGEMGKQCGLLRHILQPVLQRFAERVAAQHNYIGVLHPANVNSDAHKLGGVHC